MDLLYELERRLGVLDEVRASVALWAILADPARCCGLVRRMGGVREVLAHEALWQGTDLPGRAVRSVEREEETMRQLGVLALTPRAPLWPAALAQCIGPPELLFVRGCPEALHAPATIGVVGSRHCGPLGRDVVTRMVGSWAGRDVVIVSGGARGVDERAHAAAVESGGRTVVVLASGLVRPYPAGNRALFERVMEKGCLVTEMVSQGTVLPYCFPKRNRLIAALADATVVIQARLGSGALHTARFAQRAGKPVLAVPGPVLDPLWAGSNQLLREGGEVLTGPEQCLLGTPGGADECRPRGTTWSASDLPPAIPRIPRNDLDKPGAFCLDLLARGVQHTDDLVAQTGWSSGALSRVLLQLEMKGLVVMRPGNLYEATVVVEE